MDKTASGPGKREAECAAARPPKVFVWLWAAMLPLCLLVFRGSVALRGDELPPPGYWLRTFRVFPGPVPYPGWLAVLSLLALLAGYGYWLRRPSPRSFACTLYLFWAVCGGTVYAPVSRILLALEGRFGL